MFQSIDTWARWWVDGLTDVLVGALDRVSGGRRYQLRAAEGRFEVVDASGRRARTIGTIRPGETVPTFDPRGLATRLRGADVELAVPPGWLFRRPLEPVALQSVPYLDAFVRHHVERVTPWRVQDTYYGVATAPIPEDPNRMAVTLGVVPRNLLAGIVEAVTALGPRRFSIATTGPDGPFAIPLASEDKGRTRAVRRFVGAVLTVLVLATVGLIAAGSWRIAMLEEEIAEIDRMAGERRDFLRAAAERSRPKDDPAAGLRAQRAAVPPAVMLLEALSAALPDQAHVTDLRIEKDQIRVIGVAQDVSALIAPLEDSPLFRSVSFFAPSTRLQTGRGDRFNIEMRLEPVKSAETPPTPDRTAEARR